jgi:predicted nuclease with TOPRIM domain
MEELMNDNKNMRPKSPETESMQKELGRVPGLEARVKELETENVNLKESLAKAEEVKEFFKQQFNELKLDTQALQERYNVLKNQQQTTSGLRPT